MFGIGFSELLVVLGLVLVLFGPDKLPEIARSIGKFSAIIRRNSDALRREFYNTVYEPAEEIKSRVELSAREIMGFSELNDPALMNCEQKARAAEEKKQKEESPPESAGQGDSEASLSAADDPKEPAEESSEKKV